MTLWFLIHCINSPLSSPFSSSSLSFFFPFTLSVPSLSPSSLSLFFFDPTVTKCPHMREWGIFLSLFIQYTEWLKSLFTAGTFFISGKMFFIMGFPIGLGVKNLPAMPKTQVRSGGREDPLEKRMATHSSMLAWGSPWTEEPGRLQSLGLQKSQTQLKQQHAYTFFIISLMINFLSFISCLWKFLSELLLNSENFHITAFLPIGPPESTTLTGS